ncbi:inorganic phosphate transporter [Mesosutterella sp. OilRF-GAM-744-9]|uniref:Phosphate transporter n=1 Tax=Mesosutterella porci TaxID=2915351 RepID=A0ABS9MTH0_9BURK|nr:inorganic phosphate transporter [Mesosutterella sp. oilRF-744-WT-GAM-9]MCG5031930.1 inorganic phosphate transporter [Mesosutterella sp. oilRF-744-WT-GAM-9]
METFYLVILGFLALLAVIDLFVGVSNDATNFLNSAVGCRIAPFKVILAVAGAGVLLGATFSGGMMEIAKSGVFNPGMFTFKSVMVIYLSVMVTDVMLLNFFNSLGLPTSTSVSIVFELLGASVGVAANEILSDGGTLSELGGYINNEKAFAMIAAILVSVVVAFVSGVVVQYLMRMIFTFRYEKTFRKLGGLFGGFSLAMVFYFLVMKGARGASFMTPELLAFLDDHTWQILGSIFVAGSVVLQLGMAFFRLNVFRVVILAGTFALAFAFAGNDLVNFVGVPIAALDSWKIYSAGGGAVPPEAFYMDALALPIAPPTVLLLLSGIVMVLTLRFSKSARRVIETSLNLSSSSTGDREQFGASAPGRLIVRTMMGVGQVVLAFVPLSLQRAVNRRFEPVEPPAGTEPLPFDYVRASVNLILTAILISTATSMQLPLSTTYVTFMVGMGSSLADRAWDRESAVYRISGVLVVVVGWFLTALTAFIAASLVATLVLYGGRPVSVLLIVLVLAVIVRMNLSKRRDQKKKRIDVRSLDRFGVRTLLNEDVARNYIASVSIFSEVVNALLVDSERALRHTNNRATVLMDEVSASRSLYYTMAKYHGTHDDLDARFLYYRSLTNMKEVCRSLQRVASQAQEHVANRHRIFSGNLAQNLVHLAGQLAETEEVIRDFSEGWASAADVQKKGQKLIDQVARDQEALLAGISEYRLSLRGCELYMTFLQFVRDIVNHYSIVVALQNRLNEICAEDSNDLGDPKGGQASSAPAPLGKA